MRLRITVYILNFNFLRANPHAQECCTFFPSIEQVNFSLSQSRKSTRSLKDELRALAGDDGEGGGAAAAEEVKPLLLGASSDSEKGTRSSPQCHQKTDAAVAAVRRPGDPGIVR